MKRKFLMIFVMVLVCVLLCSCTPQESAKNAGETITQIAASLSEDEEPSIIGFWNHVGQKGAKYSYKNTTCLVYPSTQIMWLDFMQDGEVKISANIATTYFIDGNILTLNRHNYPTTTYEIAELTANRMVLISETVAMSSEGDIPICHIFERK